MMTRIRDYAAEYARRVALGESRGLSRSQARGHARIEKGERPVTAIKSEAKRIGVSFEIIARSTTKRVGDTSFTEKVSGSAWNQSQIKSLIDNARDQGKELVRAIYKKPRAKHGHTSNWYSIRTEVSASFAAASIAAGLESYENDDDEPTPEYDGDDLFALAFV